MRIAIASGKGGTGKTTVAVNLAVAAAAPVLLLDCDVEEPNCHLFLKQADVVTREVTVPVPQVDEEKCDGCAECARFCRFNAIVSLATKPLVFPELCHGCGGCALVCPKGAISEVPRRIGVIETGRAGAVTLLTGRLDVGAPMAPPLVRALKSGAGAAPLVILDAPPGTSCPVVTTVRDCDYTVLVTEPTPFGLHDLVLAVDMMRALDRPFGVVINRAGSGDDRVARYCARESVRLLASVPDDRRIAEAYSRGELIVGALPAYRRTFEDLLEQAHAAAAHAAGAEG